MEEKNWIQKQWRQKIEIICSGSTVGLLNITQNNKHFSAL